MKQLYRLSPEERNQIRDQLAAELSQYPDVLFAYTYGSFVDSESFHDVDIGVYLSGSTINAKIAADLSQRLSGKIKLPVNVRILNAAPISFRFHVLRGECLFSRNDDLRTDIMEDIMRRYFRHRPPAPARHKGGLRHMTLNPDLIRARCLGIQERAHGIIRLNLGNLRSFASAMVRLI